jgi:hypothetical protein
MTRLFTVGIGALCYAMFLAAFLDAICNGWDRRCSGSGG